MIFWDKTRSSLRRIFGLLPDILDPSIRLAAGGGQKRMPNYILLAIIMRFLVDFMLLMAAIRLSGIYVSPFRAAFGAAVGSAYAAACTVARLWFLEGSLWHGVSLVLVCLAAFGMERSALRPGALYCLLRLALDALTAGTPDAWDILWAAILCGVCLYVFRGGRGARQFVPVELYYGEKAVKLFALRDTGNDLRDPVTGKPVLVVGADVAAGLTGLTAQQLMKPVETMGLLPGLRLIPYKTVGQSGGLLLALQIKNARIGKWKGSSLVAFAPQVLDEEGTYQALIGGAA